MSKTIFNRSLVLLSFCFFAGCSQTHLPSDLPKLFPTAITVTQEGVPLGDALVTLASIEENGGKWPCVGKTNAQGIADMSTNGMYHGVAAGKYKVAVIKQEKENLPDPYQGAPDPKVDMDKYQEWYMKNESKIAGAQRQQAKIFSCVEEKYNSLQTTPLEVEIIIGTNKHSVDVGKAVKEEFKDNHQ